MSESLIKRLVQMLSIASLSCSGTLLAALPDIRFEASRVEYGEVVIEDLRLQHLNGADVQVDAGVVLLQEQGSRLRNARLTGRTTRKGDELALTAVLAIDGFEVDLELRQGEAFEAKFGVRGQAVAALAGYRGLPAELAWASRGTLDLALSYVRPHVGSAGLTYRLALNDLAFDSPDGRFAGEALFIDATGALQLDGPVAAEVEGGIRSGELLVDNFYRDFSTAGIGFELQPAWQGAALDTGPFRIGDGTALTIEGRAKFGLSEAPVWWELEVSRLEMAFPEAYWRYIEPTAATWTLDGLATSGKVSWSGDWSEGRFQSGDLRVTDLTVVDTQRNRFAFTGLDAHHRPGDHAFDSRFSWRGLLFGRINLGAGEMALDSAPGVVALVEPLSMDVFDGQLNIHEFKIVLPGSEGALSGEPDIRLRAELYDMDMEQVTAAMGWPAFAGKISGEIPGVQLQHGVLDVDGEIRVDVFDGAIALSDLRIERPFGVLPSLAANVKVENLDLESLTSTFSFGQISGRLDGYVRELRMLDWRPVAFDAWLGTPHSQNEKNDISRKAVNRLTTIGGGSATTALTSPLLRVFSHFSYRRIGLGCVLQNNTCEISGIGEDDVSVLLLEGAGIPKITIRAFNRRVDWQQMVSNLLALSGEESIRVGN